MQLGDVDAVQAVSQAIEATRSTVTPAFIASAAATPAASPIAMQGGISREMRCAAAVEE